MPEPPNHVRRAVHFLVSTMLRLTDSSFLKLMLFDKIFVELDN